MPRFDMTSVTLGALLDDAEASAVIEQAIPGATNHPMIKLARGWRAVDALKTAGGALTEKQRDALAATIGDL